MYLPLELLHEIILIALSPSTTSEEIGVSTKQNWSSIESLTLASKSYRKHTFHAWFRVLFATSPSDILELQQIFPECSEITRELHCVQPRVPVRKSYIWDLRDLHALKKIRLDWLPSQMLPHYGSNNTSHRLPFKHTLLNVQEFEIRGIPWPSPNVLLGIHTIFPRLGVLRLRQQRIWCGLCHTCCVSKFKAPGPDRLVYQGGIGLPMHYARVLGDLQHLHTVSVTIADFGEGKTTLGEGLDQNPHLWMGECDSCMQIMYEDESFRDDWVAMKKGAKPKKGYTYPPALRMVEWKFWKAEAMEEEIEVEESGEEDESDDDLTQRADRLKRLHDTQAAALDD